MEFQSIQQSMISSSQMSEIKSLQLKEGQIVNGKINKLFPNQMAEVQIGSNKVIAQLQAPLQVNERNWFVVQFHEGQTQLKVVPNANKQQMVTEEVLLKQLQIAPTKSNIQLVSMLEKNDLPISKDIISNASEWMKSHGNSSVGMEAVKLMLQRNYPFTKDTFLAITALMEDSSIVSQVSHLKELIHQQSTIGPKEQQLVQLLTKFSATEGEKMGQLLLGKLINESIASSNQSENALKLLKSLDVVSQQTTKQDVVQLLWQASGKTDILQSMNESREAILTNNRDLTTAALFKLEQAMEQSNLKIEAQNLLQQVRNGVPLNEIAKKMDGLINQLQTTILKDNVTTNNLVSQFLSSNNGACLPQLTNLLSGNFTDSLQINNAQKILVLQLAQQLQLERTDLTNSNHLKNHLVDFLKGLGLQHEKNIVGQMKNGNESTEQTLKSLLLQYTQEATGATKASAEQLVSKLTGFQLASQEVNSILQLNYQIPIPFWDQTKDLTIQWSGKKTKNGEINPDHCRVLFYLELETMGLTTVDMQVQNRVIHITVVNETDKLKQIAKPFMDRLKENLEKLDYKLSHLTFSKKLKEEKTQATNVQSFASIIEPKVITGVDFRI